MNQAVILAGGQATRMRPYTDERPKALVEIAGVPIVEHQIRWLAANGVSHAVISCGYKAEMLEDTLGDGSDLGVKVTFAIEDEPLGRGGGLKFAARRLPEPGARWLGMNGDVITSFKLNELADQHAKLHKTKGVLATLALAPYRSNWGVAELDGELITGFTQSPRLPYWINAGIYAMEGEIIDLLPDKGDHEDTTFPELSGAGKIGHYDIEDYWRGIDTAKDIKEAGKELAQGF